MKKIQEQVWMIFFGGKKVIGGKKVKRKKEIKNWVKKRKEKLNLCLKIETWQDTRKSRKNDRWEWEQKMSSKLKRHRKKKTSSIILKMGMPSTFFLNIHNSPCRHKGESRWNFLKFINSFKMKWKN